MTNIPPDNGPSDSSDLPTPPPAGGGLPPYGSYQSSTPPPPPPGGTYPPPPPGGGYPPYGDPAPYSATDAVAWGWKKFKENPAPWLILSGGWLVLSLIFGGGAYALTGGFSTDTAINASFYSHLASREVLNFVLGLVGYIVSAVAYRGALDATEGRKFDLGAAFGRVKIGQAVLLGIVLAILSVVFFLLCCFPTIIFGVAMMFAMPVFVDRDASITDAMKGSYQIVKSNVGDSILLVLLNFVVMLVGLVLCCVGTIVARPVTELAVAYTYKRLQNLPVAP